MDDISDNLVTSVPKLVCKISSKPDLIDKEMLDGVKFYIAAVTSPLCICANCIQLGSRAGLKQNNKSL